MEYLRVESLSPIVGTNPFLLSWLRGGSAIDFLFLKEPGSRTKIYCGRGSESFLLKAGWKFSSGIGFNFRGRRIFTSGDSRLIHFANENLADRIVELLNEEDSGFLRMSIRPHYFRRRNGNQGLLQGIPKERKMSERKGWKIVLTYRNENLGNYLCHIFSSQWVRARKGRIGFESPVVAWWEVSQFIPTRIHPTDKGDVKIGTTPKRGEVFIDSQKNPHSLIVGASGAGKSSLIFHAMNNILEERAGKVILIDPHGDTARKMCETTFTKFVISPDSESSVNVIGWVDGKGLPYKVAEDFVSILRSFREVQYTDPLVGPRMEDILSRGISLLARVRGMTLVDFYNILKDGKVRKEIAATTDDQELRNFLDELEEMSREEKASTERAIGRLANDPIIRSFICNPNDSGTLRKAIQGCDLVIINLDRGRLGYEDSRLLSNIFALYIWQIISSTRGGNYFLFLEEGHDYQSTLISDILSSGRKFGVRVFFVTTSFRAIHETLQSLIFSNISNYIFMKLTDPDKVNVREFTGTSLDLPKDPMEFVLLNPYGQERGNVEPVNFSGRSTEFKQKDFDFATQKGKIGLSFKIDSIISEMKSYDTLYFIYEEFCKVLSEYNRQEVILALKEKVARDKDIHFVGRINIKSGTFRGRHECFQVRGNNKHGSARSSEFKVTSDLIATILEKNDIYPSSYLTTDERRSQ